MNTRNIGNKGENIACIFLERRGFVIIARNYQRKWGEIDIIAEKEGIIHFCEVKSITHRFSHITDNHRPEENVHSLKLRHLSRMIETFLSDTGRGQDVSFQIDVLSVYMDQRTRLARVEWIENIIL